jgi:hypothetical protein
MTFTFFTLLALQKSLLSGKPEKGAYLTTFQLLQAFRPFNGSELFLFVQPGQDVFYIAVGSWYYVDGYQFTDSGCCCGSRIGGGFDGAYVASHHDRYKASAYMFLAD